MAEIDLTNQYLNALNEAMAIHAKNAITGLNFNKTEVAEIVSIKDANKGDYIVDNGSVKYHAYIENSSYTLGTKVYVLIQNNDYSQRKLILGKVKRSDDMSIDYISPLSQYEPADFNLIEDETYKIIDENDSLLLSITELDGVVNQLNYNNLNGTQLLANFNKEKQEQGQQYSLIYLSKDLSVADSETGICKYNQDYKYLGLSADFKSLFSTYAPFSGGYGLEVFIQYSQPRGGSTEERDFFTSRYRLDSTTMIGAVYDFKSYFNQEALFELPAENGTVIHRVAIFFFQDGDFLYKNTNNENVIVPYKMGDEFLPDNIYVKNIDLRFGTEKIDSTIMDTVELFTNNGTVYDSAQLNDTLIEKRIEVNWKHRNPETDEMEQITSFNKKVKTQFDVESKSRISWYTDAEYTAGDYRAELEAQKNTYDRLGELLEKYEKAMPNRYLWVNKWQEVYEQLGENASTEERKTAWTAIQEEYGTSVDFTNDDMLSLIEELSLKNTRDYYYDPKSDFIILTPTGLQTADRAITRNNKSLATTLSISDTLAGEGWVPIDGGLDVRYIDYLPDRKRRQCRVKCIVEYGPKLLDEEGNETDYYNTQSSYYHKIESNILVLTNLTAIPDPGTQDASIGIQFDYSDKSNGTYPLYSAVSNKLLEPGDATYKRTLTAELISRYSGKSYLNGQETLIWKVPKTNTMINLGGTLIDEPDYEYIKNEETGRYEKKKIEYLDPSHKMTLLDDSNRELLENNGIEFDLDNFYYIMYSSNNGVAVRSYLKYYIEEDLVRSKINNTIYCYLIKNNNVFSGSTTMNFTQHGSAGTDYTFVFGLSDVVDENWNVVRSPEAAITLGEKVYHRITFDLYDAEGTQINLTEEEKNEIIKLWVEFKEDGYYSGLKNASEKLTNENGQEETYLQFLTKEVKYLNNTNPITYYTDVAVRANPELNDLSKLHSITLLATVKAEDATVAYNNRNYTLHNIDFSQCLSLVFRTQRDYTLKGTTIFYYNDSGAVVQGSPVRYSLVGHDIEDIMDQAPIAEPYQEQLDNIVKQIIDVLGEAQDNLGTTYSIFPTARTATKMDTDVYGRIVNYKTLVDDLMAQQEELSLELANINLRINEINNQLDTSGMVLYVDSLLSALRRTWRNSVTLIKEYGGVFSENDTVLNNLEEVLEIAAELEEESVREALIFAVENYSTQYNIYINARDVTQLEWLELLKTTYTQVITFIDGKIIILNEYKRLCDDFDVVVENYDGSFSIEAYNETTNEYEKINDEEELIYYPYVVNEIYSHTVMAPALFINNLSRNINVVCAIRGQVVYSSPILMIQNKYQIPALNKWDGKLIVDADNNEIMAATIAAGHKENDNTFTGVIMGDIGRTDNNTFDKTTGLFGYHQGSQSFGFKSDGTGFIGKNTTGRIEFNGIDGHIQSANYTASENTSLRQGTRIDLSTGLIDMFGVKDRSYTYDSNSKTWVPVGNGTQQTRVQIGTLGTYSDPYFRIAVPSTGGYGGDNNNYGLKSLITIDNNDYYLQTANYGGSSGLRIDLNNGSFDSKGILTINGASGSSINFGEFQATPGGGLIATNGSIGGWTISNTSLSGGGITMGSGGSIGADNGKWNISSGGEAYFQNINCVGGYIGNGSNQWTLGGNFDFGLGTISLGNMGYGSQGINFGNGKATVSGTIYANAGKIGGWNIDNDSIDGGSTHLYTNGKISMGADLEIGGYKILFGDNSLYSVGSGLTTNANFRCAKLSCDEVDFGTYDWDSTDVQSFVQMWQWYQNNKDSLATQSWVNSQGFTKGSIPSGNRYVKQDASGNYYITI